MLEQIGLVTAPILFAAAAYLTRATRRRIVGALDASFTLVFGAGPTPMLVDRFIGYGAFGGQLIMRLVAGPARADHLARASS